MSDVVCRIEWTREDVATVLEESGKTPTEEEINRFIEKFNWENLREKTISDGFDMMVSGL